MRHLYQQPLTKLPRNPLTMRVLLLAILFFSTAYLSAQEVRVMKFPELQKKILTADAPLTIFNFWATWCGPCVREMPHFDAYETDPEVKVYFVSLDFPDQLERVKKFVANKSLKAEVILLDESDYDAYMGKVSKEWSGAIPASLFVDEWGKTYFHEKEISKEELARLVAEYSN